MIYGVGCLHLGDSAISFYYFSTLRARKQCKDSLLRAAAEFVTVFDIEGDLKKEVVV